MQSCHTRNLGFTLIELLVTLTIIAVLAAVAAPSFRDFVASQRVKNASYDISYALANARSEALKRNADVVVSSASGGWQNGWTVTSGTNVLTSHEAFSGLTVSGPATDLTYNNSGRLKVGVNPFGVRSTSSSTVSPRCVSIDLSGLAKSKGGVC